MVISCPAHIPGQDDGPPVPQSRANRFRAKCGFHCVFFGMHYFIVLRTTSSEDFFTAVRSRLCQLISLLLIAIRESRFMEP